MSDRSTKPATAEQIITEVMRIVTVTKPPKDMAADKLVDGYVEALGKFTLAHIRAVVTRFCEGGYAPGLSNTWAPMPLELAQLVREYQAVRQVQTPTGGKYSYRMPRSLVLHQEMTRDTLRRLVDEGVIQRGAIWLPGDPDKNPEYGMVFAPDPTWQGPRPVVTEQK